MDASAMFEQAKATQERSKASIGRSLERLERMNDAQPEIVTRENKVGVAYYVYSNFDGVSVNMKVTVRYPGIEQITEYRNVGLGRDDTLLLDDGTGRSEREEISWKSNGELEYDGEILVMLDANIQKMIHEKVSSHNELFRDDIEGNLIELFLSEEDKDETKYRNDPEYAKYFLCFAVINGVYSEMKYEDLPI